MRSRWWVILTPGAILFALLFLNNLALRTGVGPTEPAFWLLLFIGSVAGLTLWMALLAIGKEQSPWRAALATVASAVVWWVVASVVPHPGAEREIMVGDRGGRPGGGFTQNVSNNFKRRQLEALLARANHLAADSAYNEFTCGDEPPAFLFQLTLAPAEEYRERLVYVSYTPKVDVVTDRCLYSGLHYLIESAVAAVDPGPPVDYGYVNPSTGQKLAPYVRTPRKPVCRCDLRYSGREWVAYSPELAAQLR